MTRKIFIASVCLNIGLAVGWAFLANSRPPRPERMANPTTITAGQAKAAAVTAKPGIVTNMVKVDFEWPQLETTDYKDYISKLRAIGCPESTIQDIILAELDYLYEPKLNVLKGLNVPSSEKFWTNKKHVAQRLEGADKEIKALQEERAALVKELLGVEEKSLRVTSNYFDDAGQSRYSYLPADLADRLEKLEIRYEKSGGAARQTTGYQNEEARQKMLTEMKKFMTPEQIIEYELRTSNQAKQLRNSLKDANVSESEFRSIFTAAYEYKQLTAATNGDEKPTAEQLQAAKKKSDDAIKDTVGEERYAELQRMKDPSYRTMAAAAPFLGYDRAALQRVSSIRADAEAALRTVTANEALSPEQKGKALLDIQNTTQQAVQKELGEKGSQYYQKAGGYWLRGLGTGHIFR